MLEQPPQKTPEPRQQRVRKIFRNLRYLVGLSGAGFGVTQLIQHLKNGEIWEALLFTVLTVAAVILAVGLTFIKDVLSQVLDEVEILLQSKVPLLSHWIVEQLVNLVVEGWSTVTLISQGFRWRATSKFKRNYYEYLINTYKPYSARTSSAGRSVTLDLDLVFVKPLVATTYPDKVSVNPIGERITGSPLSIWDFISKSRFERVYRCIALLGPAGSGKTTLLEHLVLAYAQKNYLKQQKQVPNLIPVLLPLWQVHSWILEESAIDLPEVAAKRLGDEEFYSPLDLRIQWFQAKLRIGKCLVLFDGLDEIADLDRRYQVGNWIDQQIKKYPKSLFIITSRRDGYFTLKEVKMHLEIKSFNTHQRQELLYNFYFQDAVLSQTLENPKQIAEIKQKGLTNDIRNYSELAEMARNPLLLTMMAIVYDRQEGNLPASRIELYDSIFDALLIKQGNVNTKAFSNLGLKKEQIKSILKLLATQLMSLGKVAFNLSEDKELIQKILTSSPLDSITKLEVFVQYAEQVAGILVKKEGKFYEFFHPSFQEYLASSHIESLNNSILMEKICDPWWHETISLYATKNDISDLVVDLLTSRELSSNALAFICDFIEDNPKISSEKKRELDNYLKGCLASNNLEVFRTWAEGKLLQRLKKLSRKNGKIIADSDYITHAEYQLFVDESSYSMGHPSHWRATKFEQNLANSPIIGVTSSQAELFCEWLNRKFTREKFSQHCSYRLPNKSEADRELATEIGFWYQEGTSRILAKGRSEHWKSLEKNVSELVKKRLRGKLLLVKESFYSLDTIGFERDTHRKEALNNIFDIVLDSDSEIDLKYLDAYSLNIDETIAAIKSEVIDIRNKINRPARNTVKNNKLLLNLQGLNEILDNNELPSIPSEQHLLLAYSLYVFLQEVVKGISGRSAFVKVEASIFKGVNLDKSFVLQKQRLLHAYAHSLVVKQRQEEKSPAWEGILIVRENLTNNF